MAGGSRARRSRAWRSGNEFNDNDIEIIKGSDYRPDKEDDSNKDNNTAKGIKSIPFDKDDNEELRVPE
ncbi:hypothetical protein ACRALDRAFT_1070510 [Sodiomyces alcalophilus JCM 7366]|uniref:uncharacterized protein n=1 Tax=Sodiomyces alcalophilus JCM 7366 TaxID=591952 RepID=UPI0039B58DBD